MKVVVKVVGDGAQVEVSAGSTPRYLEQRETAHMLAWAEERGLKYVEWMYPSGRVTVTRCRECGEPNAGSICNYCFPLRQLPIGPDKGQLSAEELEHRSQVAESLATKYAQLSIDLAACAALATPDPIEIEVVPAYLTSNLDEMLSQLIKQSELHTLSGADLDKWVAVHGIKRSNHGGFTESDDSLRRRIQVYMNPKKQSFSVSMDAVHGLRIGDTVTLGTNGVMFNATVTGIMVNQGGVVEVTYEATLPNPIDKLSISCTVE